MAEAKNTKKRELRAMLNVKLVKIINPTKRRAPEEIPNT